MPLHSHWSAAPEGLLYHSLPETCYRPVTIGQEEDWFATFLSQKVTEDRWKFLWYSWSGCSVLFVQRYFIKQRLCPDPNLFLVGAVVDDFSQS